MVAVASRGERFEGFSDDALQFLLELQAEQSRAWFKAHQDDFVRLCRRPLELFVEELCARVADAYPAIQRTAPHYFRIQRDTRFTRDKAPYKSNVAADVAFRAARPGEDGYGIPGLYVSFGLDGELVAVGVWQMAPEVLGRYRALLDHARTGAIIQREVDALIARGASLTAMEQLKRVPPPYPRDHPRGELLRYKGLALTANAGEQVTGSRALLTWAEDFVRAAAPLVHLLDAELHPA